MISATTSAACTSRAAGTTTATTEPASEASAGEASAGTARARGNRAADGCDHDHITHLHAAEDLGAARIRGAHGDRHRDGLAVDEQTHRAPRNGSVECAGGDWCALDDPGDD